MHVPPTINQGPLRYMFKCAACTGVSSPPPTCPGLPRSLGHACVAGAYLQCHARGSILGHLARPHTQPWSLVPWSQSSTSDIYPGNGGAYMTAGCVLAPPPGQQRGRQPQDAAAPCMHGVYEHCMRLPCVRGPRGRTGSRRRGGARQRRTRHPPACTGPRSAGPHCGAALLRRAACTSSGLL